MENASKALIIAGGMLLAIMTLSLLLYMASSTTRIAQAQDEKTASEQIAAFNSEYEAYNKRVMYGTDLISVANKAIDYNKKLDASHEDEDIQIIIETIQKFETTEQTITVDSHNNKVLDESNTKTLAGASLDRGEYTINYATVKSDKIVDFFKQKPEEYTYNVKETTVNGKKRVQKTVHYSALSNFKRAIFECTKVEYSEENGRIESMNFKQKKVID